MRTLIVYFSKFGNTRRLAEAMAETMRQAGDARVVDIDRLATSDFEGVDLVVMGSPTHAFTVPAGGPHRPGVVAAGDSRRQIRGRFRHHGQALAAAGFPGLARLLGHLTRLGGQPIAKPETFFVRTRNPQKTGEIDLLLAGELERARKWAARTPRIVKSQRKRMRNRIVVILATVIVLASGCQVSQALKQPIPASQPVGIQDERTERIARVIRDTMRKEGIPGVSIAVIDSGEIVWAQGFGWRDVGKRLARGHGDAVPGGLDQQAGDGPGRSAAEGVRPARSRQGRERLLQGLAAGIQVAGQTRDASAPAVPSCRDGAARVLGLR